ncbi:16S rRNA (guanine(966)-N(2))-methyltransferase RsmD [Bacillus aquiflavi]|uniref:16S rRNA (Guanine(966)-N(2))-methyltransferase RsmD n=1 Tax=Bacillus aquiflavi TaxID=2672567 RepID=A0A6B3W5C6_9BACI|nr:16S rRNA (guanine(966)-N(2))-methyltransferase RsmD [Bacillus aquiflavi]MBA4538809.1 16S rRNA (guanine(966)-N(2))-methyltransferase RsmD [Bacillus aquiflavi]NEY83163.1 16S rRNA (guanine(966)-N(2))-methyltransferase RsmD [Bacillus aquiflavi]UAC49287.1 16S rRNA (guanine(966)-N(2))-methyltransferase RsmD [Bacillus aquiflavi]
MRVVSGTCKGRSLKPVPGKQTRPTTDKVKEAIFNMIGPYFDGGLGLDLFAGSGSLGIEALSRGLDKVIFVDRDMKAFQVIKHNIVSCRLTEQSEIYRNDSERALKALIKRGLVFDYIFLDPPYKKQKLQLLIETIEKGRLLKEHGVIVCEHDCMTELQDNIGTLTRRNRETYGMIDISIYT